jgi:hypothetical protein
MVKRQIAAIPVAAQEPVKGIEEIATIGLLTLAIDGFPSAGNPTGASAPITKVGSYIVTDMGGSATVQTPQGQIYRCSTFLVQDEGAGIKCEPPWGNSNGPFSFATSASAKKGPDNPLGCPPDVNR